MHYVYEIYQVKVLVTRCALLELNKLSALRFYICFLASARHSVFRRRGNLTSVLLTRKVTDGQSLFFVRLFLGERLFRGTISLVSFSSHKCKLGFWTATAINKRLVR